VRTSVDSARLSHAACALRVGHAAISVAFLAAIAHIWWCALTGRRGRWLRVAVGALLTEGAVVGANHGDCPLGPLQARLDDPVPLFELVLSPAAARRAVPALGGVAGLGMALLVWRGRRPGRRATCGPSVSAGRVRTSRTAFRPAA
jgi:hypothetical protein